MPKCTGCVNHSRTPALQAGKGESGGALGGLEERGDSTGLWVNRVTLTVVLG